MKPGGDDSECIFLQLHKKPILGHYKCGILAHDNLFVHKARINLEMRSL